jgi:endonuclease/exonuclease/phosphatase family metal-dependent hydrolase
MTYNIWFSNITKPRIQALLAVLRDADADYLCLQEVTAKTREVLLNDPFIKETYCKHGAYSGNSFHTFYGVMIFCKYPAKFFELEFEATMMGRSLLICQTFDQTMPVVATAHFESLDSANIRKSQMEQSTLLLNQIESETRHGVVMIGDFNFDPKDLAEEKVLTDNGFKDVVTDFVDKGAFSMAKTPKFAAWRPDKVTISQSSEASLEPIAV